MILNHRCLLLGCLTFLFLFAVSPGRAAQEQPLYQLTDTDKILETDTRLKQTITLDEVGIPLQEVLKKVSSKGLIITCGSSCAEQKIHIRLKNRPLFVLMQSLAELMPGKWLVMSDKSGYKLNMTDEAVRYRARWWELFTREQERAIAAQRAYVLDKMREVVTVVEANDPVTLELSQASADRATRHRSFYRLLPAPLQEQIAAHMLLSVFYSKDGATDFPEEDETVVALSALPEAAQSIIRENVPSLQPGEDVQIAFCNVAIGIMPRIIKNGRSVIQANTPLGVGLALDAVVLHADQPGFVEIVKRRGVTAPAEWQRLAAYQQNRVWKNDLLVLADHMSQPYRRAEILDWLATQADMEFVGDYYAQLSVPLSLEQKAQKPVRTVKEELNYRASEQDFSWKQRTDSVYLVRNNRWYRDDKMEVAASLLRQWTAAPLPPLNAKLGQLPDNEATMRRITAQLDREVDIYTNLTVWQIGNGLENYVVEAGSRKYDPQHPNYTWRPFAHIAKHTLRDLSFIEFYASLTLQQRRALIGGSLAYASLTPQVQQRAQYLTSALKALLRDPSVAPVLDIRCEIPIFESLSGGGSDLEPVKLFNFNLTIALPHQ